MKHLLFKSLAFLFLIGFSLMASAQYGPIKNLRYEDDFSYLLNDTIKKNSLEKLKYLSLSKDTNSYVSLGGEVREWYEIRENPNFGDVPPSFIPDPNGSLLHRMMLHADFHLNSKIRIFTQLNNTLEFGNPNPPIPEILVDGLDLHQLFVELDLGKKHNLLRLGRQEISFGNELLISSREGPNNRLAFDGITYTIQRKKHQIHFLGATPVIINPEPFDNSHINEAIWGTYASLRKAKHLNLDLYYLGYYSERRAYNWTPGIQNRHTVGSRISHHSKALHYELETAYQTGTFNDLTIHAANATGEIAKIFDKVSWKPMIGIGASYITGDYNNSDGQLNTYDPMYPKPVYGLATPQGPSNITHIKPMVGIQPRKNLMINLSWYLLNRASTNDGSYSPGMDQVRPFPGANSNQSSVATQYTLDLFYTINQNLSFITFLSYVDAGAYVKETGAGKDTYYWASALQFKF